MAELQAFAGIDPGKVQDVVGAVWDHKDDVGSAVAFFRDHGDELLGLLGRLPQLFGSAASALGQAASDTRSAAQFLTGSGGGGDGVKGLAAAAGTALDTCRQELAGATKLFTDLASALGSLPMVGGALAPLGDAAGRFDAVGAQLAVVAEQLRGIGGLVDQAGTGLASTADQLDAGSHALATFAG
jgi:hypothetical protein